MKRPLLFRLVTACCALLLLAVCGVARAQDAGSLRQQADKAFEEKSYARALQLYRQVLASTLGVENLRVRSRIALSLGETQQWADAVREHQALLDEPSGRARILYQFGRLQTKLPQQAWKIGDKIVSYADDYPEIEGAQKPVQTYTGEENQKNALKYLQEAKVAAQRDRTLRRLDPLALQSDEEIDLNFDLAAYLALHEWDELHATLQARANDANPTFDEAVDVNARFDAGWSMPKKVLFLFNEIPTLDRSKDKRDSALALLGKGLWIRSYRARMDQILQKYDDKLKKNVVRPYPFDHLEAVPVWRELVEKFPRTDLAPQALVLIAREHEGDADLVKALRAYQELVRRYPQSKWAGDARLGAQNITRRVISLDTMGAQKPGEKAKLAYSSRNVREIEFAAYPIALEKYLASPSKLSSPSVSFTEFAENFGSISSLVQVLGAPVARWRVRTQDKGDHQGVGQTIDTPLDNLGAYIIVATPRGEANLRAARLLLISDLAILKKTDRKSILAWAADARTGEAQSGVNVAIKEIYHDGTQRVDFVQARTDDAGFADKKRLDPQRYNSNAQLFAWSGQRYALTGAYSNGGWWGEPSQWKVYAYTDRPVYRPGQKAFLRAIVTQPERGGTSEPAKGQKVQLVISNPKGEQMVKKTLTTSEFGTINDEVSLPEGAPLGAYQIALQVLGANEDQIAYGGAQLRVEEYKRPEFTVTVDAPDDAVRPGETVSARINAKYYFGSPVPNANVKYTVRRRTWWASYDFPTPHDWLFRAWNTSWNPWDNERRNIGGEGTGRIVAEGTAKTDALGIAEVTFKTDPDEKFTDDIHSWWRRYSNPLYAIEVEVTDASRRTIEGAGSVKAANQDYFAFLQPQRGFFQTGDRVQVEVVTQNANDKPIAAVGKMLVFRLLPGNKEEKVFEEAARTDDKGRLFWNWEADVAGEFRIAWEGLDAQGQKVTASTNLWIHGPGLSNTTIRSRGVTIVLDKRYYEEGEVAKALLVADVPGTTVLFTQEAGGEILRRDVLRIEGKSRQIEIRITRDHVPNFSLAAAAVREFEVFQAQQEVFVPPVRALLNVKVQGDKAQYKPGEKGRFTLTATDYAGKPARAELSVAMIDASLFYIQRETAPDIRTFFYSERRPSTVNLDSHRSGQSQTHIEDTGKYLKEESHEWVLPEGFGQLQLDPSGGMYWPQRRYRANGRMRGANALGVGGGFGLMENEAMSMDARSDFAMAGAAPPAAPMASLSDAPGRMAKRSTGEAREEASLAEAKVRSNFAETAFWSPAVVTENGQATVEVEFPDSLTQWHATARGLSASAQVGSGEADVETKKNLLLRLQAPRFFVERDQVVLSANVHNYLKTDKRVKATLQAGDSLKLADSAAASALGLEGTNMSAMSGFVAVKAGEEVRVNWVADVSSPGEVEMTMTAQSDEESDAVKMTFPVLVHGVQRFAAQAGVLRADGTSKLNINFPRERKFGTSSLNVQLNPSLAAMAIDALPYLAEYPYGCVEQTTSRFVPAVLVAKTLREAGIDLGTLRTRAQAYEAESKAAPIGDRVKNSGYSYPQGQPNSRDLNAMAARLWYSNRRRNPLFDEAELSRMIDVGVKSLTSMQRGDGGWGWWPGSNDSDEWMSAYVTWSLAMAREADVPVSDQVLDRAFAYLEKQMRDEDSLHLLAHMGHALSQREVIGRGRVSNESRQVLAAKVYESRERLTAYSKSLLAMALWNVGEKDKARVVVANLENTVRVDEASGTARWQMAPQWWHWWNNDIETNAVALRAFLTVEPKNRLVPMMAKWLVTKSRAGHWESTRDTALSIYALMDYVRVNRELDVDYTLRVSLNNKVARSYRVTKENALFFDNRFIAGELFLEHGANSLSIEKKGRGNLYWSAYSEYFSLEEPIKASGNELSIRRRFFKLTRKGSATAAEPAVAGAAKRAAILPPIPVDSSPGEYDRSEINDGANLKSGDLVEVELAIEAKNDYEYLVFEDMKAAGLEPQDIRSGASYGDGLSSNVELRDEKVAFFVDRLPQGRRVLRYRMRVEIPGQFHALPTNGYAMYAPEARAISDEMRLGVKD
jgi:uncharacterized protein YfaS (alpha-2-macroglobulin family)